MTTLPHRFFSLCLFFMVLRFAGTGMTSQAASWFAATNGLAGNSGSFASPWDLQTALGKTNSIVAGDTLFLMPGNYTHTPQGTNASNEGYIFKSFLIGTVANPITITSYTNTSLAMIDGGDYGGYHANARPTLMIGDSAIATWGTYNYFKNLIFYSSSTQTRTSSSDSSFPPDITRADGPYLFGRGSMLINCIVHDLTTGGSSWGQNIGGGFYGCLFFNNGWQGTPHVHGHNIYTQGYNSSAGLTKAIQRNLFSYPFDKNIQHYGSSTAEISHYRTSQNGFIGSPSTHSGGVLIGTRNGGNANRLQDDQFTDNWGYGADLSLFYQADTDAYTDLLTANNYMVFCALQVSSWQTLTFTNNWLIEPTAIKTVSLVTNGTFIPWTFDRNNYILPSTAQAAWTIEGLAPKNFTQWKSATGYDLTSSVGQTFPTSTNYPILLTNAYDTNRANLIIYNWTAANFVAIDASSLGWGVGAAGSMFNSQDPLNDVDSFTVTTTNTIIVDMRAASHSIAVPYGAASALGSLTFPSYGQLLLLKTDSAPAPPPTNTYTAVFNSFPNAGITIAVSPPDNGGLTNGVTSFIRTNNQNVVTTITAPTVAGYTWVEWQRNGVTYAATQATTFTNTSNISLTAVYTQTEFTLTVGSSNPASGVDISISPADNNGASNGSTGFTRKYYSGTDVMLSAPSTLLSGKYFKWWTVDGLPTPGADLTITMDAAKSLSAVYTNAPAPATTNGLSFSGRRRAARY